MKTRMELMIAQGMMLLFAGAGLSLTTTEIWGQKLPQPTDLGDVAACSYLIDEFLKHDRRGTCCLGDSDERKYVQSPVLRSGLPRVVP